MKTYFLKFEQLLPVSLSEAWDFFSSPLNLEKITPPTMCFQVTSIPFEAHKMYAGMIITYQISPIYGIKMNWMTEITQVRELEYFIDEQRIGPYALWHHQHHFEEIPGGVKMTDLLNYAIPYGIIGRLVNKLAVAKKINEIFAYRQLAIEKRFGKYQHAIAVI